MRFRNFFNTFLLLPVFFFYPELTEAQTRSDRWTLEECINTALENNLSVERGELSVRDAEIQYEQSKADLFPSLNTGGQYLNRWGRSIDPTTNLFITQSIQSMGISAQSQVLLYGGIRLRNTIKQNSVVLQSNTYDLQSSRNQVMINVTTAFLNVILYHELIDNARVQLQTTQTQLETTHKQVQAGALPYSNELDLIAQVESNEVQVINAENDLRMGRLRLRQLLLIPASENFEIEMPEDLSVESIDPVSETPEQVYDNAVTIMPEIKSADLLVESSDLGVKIARGGLDPRLSVGGDIYTNYSSAADRQRFVADPSGGFTIIPQQIGYVFNPLDNSRIPVFNDVDVPNGQLVDSYPISDQLQDNWSYSLNLTLQIPIFNGLSSRANYQRAKIQAQQAEIYAEETRQNLRQSIEIAYNDALAARKTYDASQKQVASLEEAFRAARKSFDLGALNNYDFQVASNNLYRAKSDLLRAKYNYIFTVKILDFYLGKPLSLDN